MKMAFLFGTIGVEQINNNHNVRCPSIYFYFLHHTCVLTINLPSSGVHQYSGLRMQSKMFSKRYEHVERKTFVINWASAV